MGYYLSKLKSTKLEEYVGAQTIYSCADAGAFDSPCSEELEDYANQNEKIIAIVDSSGVEHFLDVIRSGQCKGRDIQMLEDVLSTKYLDGFMIMS